MRNNSHTGSFLNILCGQSTGLNIGKVAKHSHGNIPAQKNDEIHRGSYMSAHVLLNLLNEFGKRDKMRGLPSILSLFRNKFNRFNNAGA